MAEPLRPIAVPSAAPAEVVLTRADLAAPRFTPSELRTLREVFGRSFSELMDDGASDDKFVALAWIKLRRLGVEVTVAEMDDTVIEIRADQREESQDPTSGVPSASSPPSAATGG